MKRISIITINYNNHVGLQKTINSVIHQTEFAEIEYIIIDGGSTDGSRELIEEHQKHLTDWISEPDNGVYDAMNKGIIKANGEYLLFLNSGDYLSSNSVIEQVLPHMKEGIDLLYCDLKIIGKNGEEGQMTYPNQLNFKFFVTGTLPHPSTFISKKSLTHVGNYDASLKICADWKFFILSVCIHRCTYKHIPVYATTWNTDGISSALSSAEIIKQEKQEVYSTYFTSYYNDIKKLIELEKRMFYINHSYFYLPSRILERIFKN